MNAELLRLKLSILVCLSVAACFGWFVFQRFWYYFRTRHIDSVETVKVKLFPDWTLGVLACFLLWFGLAGLFVVGQMDGFASITKPQPLCEVEVAAAGSEGITLLVFDRIDLEAPHAARRRGVMVSASNGFEVEIQRTSFGPLLTLVGQRDLVRVVGIRPIGEGSANRARPSNRQGENSQEVSLSENVRSSFFLWPFLPKAESLVLSAAELKQGEVYSVLVTDAGTVELKR